MANKHVDLVFEDDGTFVVDAVGFTGKSCDAAVEAAVRGLGKVTERTYKPEHKDQPKVIEKKRVKA